MSTNDPNESIQSDSTSFKILSKNDFNHYSCYLRVLLKKKNICMHPLSFTMLSHYQLLVNIPDDEIGSISDLPEPR